MELIIQLIAGALGGNAAGKGLKSADLGPIVNSIIGLIGGVGGGQILQQMGGNASAGLDLGVIIQQVLGGGVGGAVLVAIVGALKKALVK
ncbi:MAG: hypothetical protein LBE86_09105 [Gemmobacter sp.]|jgi:uncharacterized membrane protein YeaQ/YmgE (transglycosylase-associated protein family)|nr:hypothetical protein [Gemmobacter sp.]